MLDRFNLSAHWIFIVSPALIAVAATIVVQYSRNQSNLSPRYLNYQYSSDQQLETKQQQEQSSPSSSSPASQQQQQQQQQSSIEVEGANRINSFAQRCRDWLLGSNNDDQDEFQDTEEDRLMELMNEDRALAEAATDASSSSSSSSSSTTTTTDTESSTSTSTSTDSSSISTSPSPTSNTDSISTSASPSIAEEFDHTKLPLRFGISELQGRRQYMEDRSTAVLGFGRGDDHTATRCFFGVFDGHGGDAASSWCKQKIHINLVRQDEFPQDLPAAMRNALLLSDREFLARFPKKSLDDGSTVLFTVLEVHSSRLWAANAGDSRGVLSRNGVADALSDDHKPDRPDERARIEARGGIVQQASLFGKYMGPFRVYTRVRTGGLAVSRGLGDGLLKHNDLVIAEPEIREVHLAPGDEFMILATDGLWDVFTNQQAVDFVRRHYLGHDSDAKSDPSEVADLLVSEAIHRGSLDNVTALIVFFNEDFPFTGIAPTLHRRPLNETEEKDMWRSV